MTVLLRKEIRSLLPAWIVTMAATALIAFVRPNIAPVLLFVAVIGCVLLGITSFGSEFSQGTFSVLLAQPIPRARIWRTKTITLGAALLSVAITVFVALATQFFNSWTHFRVDDVKMPAIFTLLFFGAAFAGGLLFALTIRQMATAFWVALLCPIVACGLAQTFTTGQSDKTINISVAATLAAYDVLAFLLARREFLQAQDLPGATGATIYFPLWARFRAKAHSATTAPSYRPLRALIAKEIQLHQVSLWFAASLLIMHVITVFIRRMIFVPVGRQKDLYELLGIWWLLWLFVPLMIACVAIAEERRQATLEGSLCLPARRGTQWFIKCAACFFLGILFGGIMPWLLEIAGKFIGCPAPMFQNPSDFADHWHFLGWTVTIAAVITLVAFYASSLARSLLQALGIAILVTFVLGWFPVRWVAEEMAAARTYYQAGFDLSLANILLRFGLPALLAILWLSYKNFTHLTVGWRLWLKNAFVLLAVSFLVCSAVWCSLVLRF
jgi:ABC-type transport system involved in multi-copper enzyme maturation permease subunit